jgi:hypothetical protein
MAVWLMGSTRMVTRKQETGHAPSFGGERQEALVSLLPTPHSSTQCRRMKMFTTLILATAAALALADVQVVDTRPSSGFQAGGDPNGEGRMLRGGRDEASEEATKSFGTKFTSNDPNAACLFKPSSCRNTKRPRQRRLSTIQPQAGDPHDGPVAAPAPPL